MNREIKLWLLLLSWLLLMSGCMGEGELKSLENDFYPAEVADTSQVRRLDETVTKYQSTTFQEGDQLKIAVTENLAFDARMAAQHISSDNGVVPDNTEVEVKLTTSQIRIHLQLRQMPNFSYEEIIPITNGWHRPYANGDTYTLTNTSNKGPIKAAIVDGRMTELQIGSVKLFAYRPEDPEMRDPQDEYTLVGKGDNLKSIASELGMNWKNLVELNPQLRKRKNFMIFEGEKLRIR